jgi:hypothetical protein
MVVVVGLLLVQQTTLVVPMVLQHPVAGAGGRDAGDPAPGRSPGPPFTFNPRDPSQTMERHRQELNTDKTDQKPNGNLDDESDAWSHGRHQSSTVDVPSSSHYREDVTQEYTKGTLMNDQYSNSVIRFNGHKRITVSGDGSNGPEEGHTMPVSRETNKDSTETDDDTWHQGGILDDKDNGEAITMSEEDNPSVILTSDAGDEISSLTSSADFSSYEEEEANNGTSWCGGGVKADVEVATSTWVALLNVTVRHPLFRTDYGLVRGVTYQGKRRPHHPQQLIDSPVNGLSIYKRVGSLPLVGLDLRRSCVNSKSKSHYDRQSVLVSGAHLGPVTNFSFSLRFSLHSCGFVIL